jgi:hypothetical protein
MNPVSTVATPFTTATTKSEGLHMYRGSITNDVTTGAMCLNSVSLTDGATGNNDYVAFDLFIKLDFKTAKQVYLTSGTGIVAGNPNTHIEYAGRMGFVVQGNAASSSSAADLQDLKGHTNVIIYEPNYDVHTANGVQNRNNNYASYVSTVTETGNSDPATYYGVLSEFNYDSANATTNPCIALDSTDSAKFALVTPDITTTAGNTTKTAFLTLQPGVTKIRVYMWIEGQDIDCENNATGSNIVFNVQLSTESSAAGSGGSGSGS